MADNQIQVYDPEQSNTFKFNPAEHLMQIKSGKGSSDYLEVKFRLVWFRAQCPKGTIKTEMVHLDLDRETEEEAYAWNQETRRSEKIIKRAPGIAIFHATIDDGKGGHAEATKCEKAASFGDYIEKAETGSIGRALAALGYGTQFVGEEFDEGHRIVDAPIEPRQQPAQSQRPQQQRTQPTETEQKAYRERRPVVEADPEKPATENTIAGQSPALVDMIRKAKGRAGKVKAASNPDQWSVFVSRVLGSVKPDAQIDLKDIAKINGELTKLEQAQPANV